LVIGKSELFKHNIRSRGQHAMQSVFRKQRTGHYNPLYYFHIRVGPLQVQQGPWHRVSNLEWPQNLKQK